MSGSSRLFNEKIRRRLWSKTSLILLLFLSGILILSNPQGINSHEPVTTNIRFNKEIVRIFQRHCLACHRSGSSTNISLETYATARPWAKAFKEEVLEKRMPPFQAVKGFGQFHNDYTLTQNEIDQIVAWVEGGVPKGDDNDLPREPQADDWALGKPDLLLTVKKETQLSRRLSHCAASKRLSSGSNADSYRCVVLPTDLKKARWMTAIEFHPGKDSAVHCASFGIATSKFRSWHGEGECPDISDETFGLWLPGQSVARLPQNVGRLVPAGARIVMRLHYHNSGEPSSKAQDSLGLYFATDQTLRNLRTITVAAKDENIPAAADSHRVIATYTLKDSAEAISIRPKLFPFAKSVEVNAYRPDGTIEVLVWAQNYRYDWQPQYDFKESVLLPKGTRIEVVAYIDNSESNPNNPNRPARAMRFNSTLCELSIIDAQQ